ncbi:MAG: hypothetical protein H7172_10010 [Ferruginibacter sp.]|nr:hypothetical protein [Rhodoferax sp.]
MNASYRLNPSFEETSRLPLEDWDLLFEAVLTRLRDTVARSTIDPDVCPILMECVDMLEQLRSSHPSVMPYVR